MNRRERKVAREYAMDYARRFLGVKRLPPGVPSIVQAYVNQMTTLGRPETELAQLLKPYLRRPWCP